MSFIDFNSAFNQQITGSTLQFLDFDPNINPKPSYEEGRVFYDYSEHTLSLYNSESDVTHQLGQEGYVRVYNNSGSLIPNGSVVYISGVEGAEDRPTVDLSIANDSNKDDVIGVVTHSLENNSFGYVTTWGLVSDLNTSSYGVGDTLYLSETVAGGYQNTTPSSASTVVEVGTVIKSDTTTGRILVHGSVQGPAGPQGPVGPGVVETLCSAQFRRTTGYSDIPLTWTDFSFDTEDVNTKPACIVQNVDDIHIEINESGTYVIFYQVIADDELEAQLILNDSTQIPGSYAKFGDDADTINANFPMSVSVIYTFTGGDDFKLQVQSTTTAENILAGATMGVIKLDGVKGDKGDNGADGTQGDIVWQGTWVSQNYVVNDTVEYNGSSYVCILNTVSNEIPTNGTYWDLVAEKGDQGDAGTNGTNGTNGTDGKTVLNGTVVPTTQGVDGDFYIRTTTDEIYGPKTGGSWGSPTSLIGPEGPAGGSTPTVTEASTTNTITRTVASYALVTSMTLTPAAGTYMVWFSSTLSNDQNGGQTYVALYGGGTILQHTERNMSNQSNAVTGTHFPVATNGLVTVNGSQAIEVRWKQVGGGTGSMYERTLNIMKVT